ncbi:flavin-binding monooxygenase [Histoplasma capsulatum var. duboisii H88]|uniref:Flavin-binding monooxygenase n=1 Tax=Ajellomyces capsulatus (strain H88) TaxID=544711 RepID=F0UP09_AJEC8|nr:flavin-binding monooxygenase [Histoplasma capsulatum var. duboisii H88]
MPTHTTNATATRSPSATKPLVLGSNNPDIEHPASINRPMFSEDWDITSSSGYRISDNMINEPPPGKQPFRIIMIGAGAAGIDFLHHAIREFQHPDDVEFVCYEKNHDVGGTWLENRYPGCACDVPSASYQFGWRPNPNWTHYYSPAREIWKYLRDIVDEEDMMKYIRLRARVTRAEWREERSKWVVRVEESGEDGKVSRVWDDECEVLLNGNGFLNNWKWPDIPGLMSFKGRLFHTAKYEEGLDLKGKRVAVIGSGSSGVQAVAAVYKDASRLYTWVRNPMWITAGFAQKFAGPDGGNFQCLLALEHCFHSSKSLLQLLTMALLDSEEQKEEWRRDPEKYRAYRKMIEHELNVRFRFALRNSKESDEANAFSYKEMTTKLGDNEYLKEKIIPKDFNVGCRRPTPGNGYLEALVGEKTTCYTDTIGGITPKGFLTADGTEVEVDVIICATGFDTSFRPRFPIIGLDKVDIATRWEKIPECYLSVSASNVPNYFMYSGPYSPVAQGSLLSLQTLLTNHFLQIIRKMRQEHIRRLSPKESAVEDFCEHASVYLRRTCWADPCSSWFKQGRKDGNIVMWPGSRLAFFDILKEPKYEDYEIEYWSKNRWAFLGNGFTTEEFDGSDMSKYLN